MSNNIKFFETLCIQLNSCVPIQFKQNLIKTLLNRFPNICNTCLKLVKRSTFCALKFFFCFLKQEITASGISHSNKSYDFDLFIHREAV